MRRLLVENITHHASLASMPVCAYFAAVCVRACVRVRVRACLGFLFTNYFTAARGVVAIRASENAIETEKKKSNTSGDAGKKGIKR